MYSDFEMQGIEEDKLNSAIYQAIMDRIKMEEAAASVSNGLQRESDDFEYVYEKSVYFQSMTLFFFHREQFTPSESNNVPPKNGRPPTMANSPRGVMPDGGNYVSRIQNATTNVMGRISGLGRGVGNIGGIGGIANKFLNNL